MVADEQRNREARTHAETPREETFGHRAYSSDVGPTAIGVVLKVVDEGKDGIQLVAIEREHRHLARPHRDGFGDLYRSR